MQRTLILFLLSVVCFLPAFSQEEAQPIQDATDVQEPSLSEVFEELGLKLTPEDEILVEGPTQGLFMKTKKYVDYLAIAKYSFGKEDDISKVRAGMYLFTSKPTLQLLFECGPEAGDQTRITGLPASPKGRTRFDPGNLPFGFYVQSANFNPEFSPKGETVYTQNERNKNVERFGDDLHKAHIYPYKTKYGEVPNWYVICWEFSTNNDNQDLITLVRGVKLINSSETEKQPEGEIQTTPLITLR